MVAILRDAFAILAVVEIEGTARFEGVCSIESVSRKQSVFAWCAAASLAASVIMGAAVLVAPSALASVCVHVCAIVLSAAAVALSTWMSPVTTRFAQREAGSGDAGNVGAGSGDASPARLPDGTRSLALPVACSAAAGAVLYAALAWLVGTLAKAAGGTVLGVVPAGLAISCAACLLWLRGVMSFHLDEQSRSYLDEAQSRLSDRRNFIKADFETEGSGMDERGLRRLGIACAILFALGAALSLGYPLLASDVSAPAALLFAAACLAVWAAFAVLVNRLRTRCEGILQARYLEIDRKVDIVRAERAAAEAEHMAAEAARAVKTANKQASESGMAPSLESACILAASKYGLSQRELDVLVVLASGRTRPRIAESMNISLSTVNSHIQKIYRKMGIHKSQELIDILEELR